MERSATDLVHVERDLKCESSSGTEVAKLRGAAISKIKSFIRSDYEKPLILKNILSVVHRNSTTDWTTFEKLPRK